MNPLTTSVLIFFVSIGLLFFFGFLAEKMKRPKLEGFFFIVGFAGLIFGISFSVVTATKYVVCGNHEGMILVNTDGTMQYEYNCVDGAWKPDNVIEVPRLNNGFDLKMSAHPITENPKVRNLKYFVTVKIIDLAKYFGKEDVARVLRDNDAEYWVRKTLYDFNEAKSPELGRFYNPLDKEQELQFRTLLHEFVNPQVAEHGLRVAFVKFELE